MQLGSLMYTTSEWNDHKRRRESMTVTLVNKPGKGASTKVEVTTRGSVTEAIILPSELCEEGRIAEEKLA